MRTAKRIRQYKIMAGAIVGLVLVLSFCMVYNTNGHDFSRDIKMNDSINETHRIYAQGNPFGFTDIERTVKKPKGVYRIAVLGDSFIWGDGMPVDKVWSHKLETKLLAKYDSIEVMSWGKCGWSTLDEFNFYKEHGKDFDVDLLIIGWVDNDPDVGKIQQVYHMDAKMEFPFIYKISPSLALHLEQTRASRSYGTWMRKLYSQENLNDYQQVLNSFHQYLAQNNTPSLVVMTPEKLNFGEKRCFNVVDPMITNAGFKCLNLFAPLKAKLGHYSSDELKASPVNGHPGDILTEAYSNEVLAYLEQNGYLKNLHKKQEPAQ